MLGVAQGSLKQQLTSLCSLWKLLVCARACNSLFRAGKMCFCCICSPCGSALALNICDLVSWCGQLQGVPGSPAGAAQGGGAAGVRSAEVRRKRARTALVAAHPHAAPSRDLWSPHGGAAAPTGASGTSHAADSMRAGEASAGEVASPPWACWSGPRTGAGGSAAGLLGSPGGCAPLQRRHPAQFQPRSLALSPLGEALGRFSTPWPAGREPGGAAPAKRSCAACGEAAAALARSPALWTSSDDEAGAAGAAHEGLGFTAAAATRWRAAAAVRALARMRALRSERARLVARAQVCSSL